ncbi:MAG: hypothetical protein ACXACR_15035, partial [Candidatus Hodarchaeales archaeon]
MTHRNILSLKQIARFQIILIFFILMLGIIINGWGIENLNYNRSLETDKFQIDGSTNVLKTSS